MFLSPVKNILRTILPEKLSESLKSVLPVTAVIFLLCFMVVPVPSSVMLAFIVGACLLIIGMGLFSLGADMAMSRIGEHIGAVVSHSKKLILIIVVSLAEAYSSRYQNPTSECLPNRCQIFLIKP